MAAGGWEHSRSAPEPFFMPIKNILKAARVGVGVFKSLATGKIAKILKTADDSIAIVEAVSKVIRTNERKDKRK
jgi:hypothetical protein